MKTKINQKELKPYSNSKLTKRRIIKTVSAEKQISKKKNENGGMNNNTENRNQNFNQSGWNIDINNSFYPTLKILSKNRQKFHKVIQRESNLEYTEESIPLQIFGNDIKKCFKNSNYSFK